MKIIISNCIEIKEPTKDIKEFCISKLTYNNPDYEKKKRMNFYVGYMQKQIKLYTEFGGSLYLPIGFFNTLYQYHPVASDYIDYSVVKKADIKSNIKLRDYQELATPSIEKYISGIFVLPCGLGKTELALECVSRLQQKTLFITHTTDLVKQAKERADSKMKCKTSLITDGKCDTSGDITFATIQTLIKFIENGTLKQDNFGMIIVDECHRVAVNPSTLQMFRTCVEYFAARYRLGLTATLHRADNLEECITRIIGDIIYEIKKEDNEYVCLYEGKELLRFPVDSFQVPANIKVIDTSYNVWDKDVFSPDGGTIVFAKLITDIANDKERNDLIIKTLKSIEGSTIVLSDRVDQLKYLCSMVENGVQIDGGTPKKKREKALEDARNGKYKYLFASYSLAKEGLDVKILSNLVMATPVKDFAIVTQSIGRIQRPYENKTKATVYDFVDPVGMLNRFFADRRRTYRKNNWVMDKLYSGNK